MQGRVFILIGSLAASISVLAGALGAHSLESQLGSRVDIFETAARYQMYHSLGLILVGILIRRHRRWPLRAAGWLFLSGIVLFSGSLYILSLTGIGWYGAVAPAGGACFMVGWVLLAVGALKRRHGSVKAR